MANYTSTSDLKKTALHWAGELTDGTSEYDTKCIEYINRIHLAILSGSNEFNIELGEPWAWGKANNPGVLKLEAPYETGTLSCTSGSTSATLSTSSSDSLAGFYLKISGRDELYRISAHTAATTGLTLDQGYLGSTESGLSFKAYKFDYTTTTSVMRLISPMRVYAAQDASGNDEGHVEMVSKESMLRNNPRHLILSGTPTLFCINYENTDTGVFQVSFNKSVPSNTRVEYEYIPIPADLTDSGSSIPLVPRQHRAVLAYGAAYYLLLDKSDARADAMLMNLKAGLESLVQAHKKQNAQGGRRGMQLTPRRDLVQKSKRIVTNEVLVD